jgi:hypothetical protein
MILYFEYQIYLREVAEEEGGLYHPENSYSKCEMR